MSIIKIIINDQEVTSLDQAIKLIHKAKEQEKKGLWRPDRGDEYYTITDGDELESICVKTNAFQKQADLDFSLGNCFKTFAEVQKELNKRKALTRIKDYIAKEGIEKDGEPTMASIGTIIWCLGYSMEDTEAIKKACESDLKILFGI